MDTSLAAALTLRIGERLDMDFAVRRPLAPMLTPADGPATRWNLFAGVGGRRVDRDLFLDGNTSRDGRSVESEPLVADFSLGAPVDRAAPWSATPTPCARSISSSATTGSSSARCGRRIPF